MFKKAKIYWIWFYLAVKFETCWGRKFVFLFNIFILPPPLGCAARGGHTTRPPSYATDPLSNYEVRHLSWEADSRPVMKFPAFYGAQRLMIEYARARRWILFRVSWIKPVTSRHFELTAILILSSHRRGGGKVMSQRTGKCVWVFCRNLLHCARPLILPQLAVVPLADKPCSRWPKDHRKGFSELGTTWTKYFEEQCLMSNTFHENIKFCISFSTVPCVSNFFCWRICEFGYRLGYRRKLCSWEINYFRHIRSLYSELEIISVTVALHGSIYPIEILQS